MEVTGIKMSLLGTNELCDGYLIKKTGCEYLSEVDYERQNMK